MKLLLLASRNLWRNTRRTLITLAAISFGLTMIHFTINLQTGAYEAMITQGVGALAGHVVVQAEGYQEERDADLVVRNASDVGARMAEQFPDATVAPRMFLGGLLTSTTSSVGAALSGIDPAAESEVQDLADKIVDGEWLDDDDRGILIGVKMAESLDVEVGDKVVWMGQHGDNPEMTSRLFRVKGIFRTGGAELDGFVTLAPIAATQELFGKPDVAHQVTVHLGDPEKSRPAADDARIALAERTDLEVLSWSEALPEIYAGIQLDRVSGDVMLTILLIIVMMGVLNTVLMSALERTREFGVMLAIGMKPRGLAQVILLEGAVLGVLGSALGLAGGLLVTWPAIAYGIDYSVFMGGDTLETNGLVLSTLFYSKLHPSRMAMYAVGAVFFTAFSALYPAVHVARLQPVEAMNHV